MVKVNKIRKKTTCKFKQNKKYRMENCLWKVTITEEKREGETEEEGFIVVSPILCKWGDDWSSGPSGRHIPYKRHVIS